MTLRNRIAATLDLPAGDQAPAIRIPCEVYSRIVGYIRPVSAWNEGKRQEFEDRVTYRQPEDDAE